MANTKHLEDKFTLATYDLITECEPLELQFYLFLKLYAINKHSAFPSYETITTQLHIGSRKRLTKLIKEMEEKGRLIVTRNHRQNNAYDITWYDELGAKVRVPKRNSTSTETELKGSTETELQPVGIITNRNITNHNLANASVCGSRINEILNLFSELNPSYGRLFNNKSERAAIERLVAKYGEQKMEAMIKELPKIMEKKFAPRITTPCQLENKLGELVMFVKQERSQTKSVIEV